MKLLAAVAAAVWTLLCLAIYLVVPAIMHFSGDGPSAWYAMGWTLMVGVWAVPVMVMM